MADTCINANSFYVEMAYRNQPRAIGIQDAWFAQNGRDQVVACLKASNWEFVEDATWPYLLNASTELWKQTAGLDEHPTYEDPGEADCWTAAGLSPRQAPARNLTIAKGTTADSCHRASWSFRAVGLLAW